MFSTLRRFTFLMACLLLPLSCSKEGKDDAGTEKIITPEAVDLGLSVKWASFDIGATQPGEVGYFFAWGETKPKDMGYNWKNYTLCNKGYHSLTKYNYDPAYGDNPDYRIGLKAEDDAAQVLYGGDWHVPTLEEFNELIGASFITQSIERVGFVDCMKLTSLVTGNSILLPIGGVCWETVHPKGQNDMGYYWSSQIEYSPGLYANPNPSNAHFLAVSSEVGSQSFISMKMNKLPRAYGMNIRAVIRK